MIEVGGCKPVMFPLASDHPLQTSTHTSRWIEEVMREDINELGLLRDSTGPATPYEFKDMLVHHDEIDKIGYSNQHSLSSLLILYSVLIMSSTIQ